MPHRGQLTNATLFKYTLHFMQQPCQSYKIIFIQHELLRNLSIHVVLPTGRAIQQD